MFIPPKIRRRRKRSYAVHARAIKQHARPAHARTTHASPTTCCNSSWPRHSPHATANLHIPPLHATPTHHDPFSKSTSTHFPAQSPRTQHPSPSHDPHQAYLSPLPALLDGTGLLQMSSKGTSHKVARDRFTTKRSHTRDTRKPRKTQEARTKPPSHSDTYAHKSGNQSIPDKQTPPLATPNLNPPPTP